MMVKPYFNKLAGHGQPAIPIQAGSRIAEKSQQGNKRKAGRSQRISACASACNVIGMSMVSVSEDQRIFS